MSDQAAASNNNDNDNNDDTGSSGRPAAAATNPSGHSAIEMLSQQLRLEANRNNIGYCHSCDKQVVIDQTDFSCSECHGGFVELFEPDQNPQQDQRQQAEGGDDDDDETDDDEQNQQNSQQQQQQPLRGDPFAMLFTQLFNSTTNRSNPPPTTTFRQTDRTAEMASAATPASIIEALLRLPPRQTSAATGSSSVSASSTNNNQSSIGGGSDHPSASGGASGSAGSAASLATGGVTGVSGVSIGAGSGNGGGGPTRFQVIMPGEQFDLYGIINNVLQDVLRQQTPGGGTTHIQFHQAPPIRMFQLHGNIGDYAWGNGGLDAIITQLLNQLENTGPPPANEVQLKNLPEVVINQADVDNSVQCSICMDDFELNAKAKRLPCKHLFHEPCIVEWLKLHGTCPVCRKNLNGEDTSQREYIRSPETYNQQQQQQQQSNNDSSNATEASNSASSGTSYSSRQQQQQQQQQPPPSNNNSNLYHDMDFD